MGNSGVLLNEPVLPDIFTFSDILVYILQVLYYAFSKLLVFLGLEPNSFIAILLLVFLLNFVAFIVLVVLEVLVDLILQILVNLILPFVQFVLAHAVFFI